MPADSPLHGDIHSGSLLDFVVRERLKVIDAEFGYAGREQRLCDMQEVWQAFSKGFHGLAAEKSRDHTTLAESDYVQLFLREVLQDAIGYCGTELIRHTVGMMAHVSDLDGI